MLSRALWDTGQMGRPWEYLGAVHVAAFHQRWALPYGRSQLRTLTNPLERVIRGRLGLPFTAGMAIGLAQWTAADVRDYLNRIEAVRTTANGLFAVKAHYEQVETVLLRRSLTPEDVWPDVRYVWLVREDTLRQAVSFVRAKQTSAWTAADRTRKAATYDRAAIDAALKDIARWDRDWAAFLAPRPTALRIRYEDVRSDLPSALAAVFAHLGVAPPSRWPQPAMSRQSDDTTDQWMERYKAGH